MRIRSRTLLRRLALSRAALALVFLIFTLHQPGMFAGAAAKALQGGAELPAELAHVESAVHDGHKQHHNSAAEVPCQGESSTSHHDKSCEVHCASVTDAFFEYDVLQRLSEHGFEPVQISVLADGEYDEFIRPPRYLN